MVFKKLSDKVTKNLFIFAPAYKTTLRLWRNW
jgi:hypothetical protein